MTVTPSSSTSVSTSTPPSAQRPLLLTKLTGRNGSRLCVTLLAAWILVVSFSTQVTAWAQASLTPLSGDPRPWWQASLVQLALIGLPTLLFARRWRLVRYRAIFQSWAWATGYLLLLIPTRLLAPVESQSVVLAQLLLTLLYWLLVRRQQKEKLPIPPAGMALALLVGGIAALPWLLWGALGSALDIVLNGALAFAFGLLTWTILSVAWIPAQRREPRTPRRDRLTSGLVTGVTLLILASALSFNGMQVLLMMALPAFGWAVVATGAPVLTVSLLVALPLLLVDTDSLSIAALDQALLFDLIAATTAMGIGWLLGLVALLFQPDPGKALARPLAWSGAALALLLAALIYVLAGHPGLYGDNLFVVLRDQADVSAPAQTPDLVARRQAVYQALVQHADSTQTDLRASLDRFGIGYQPYYLVNGLEVNGGLLVRLWLMSRGDVAEIMVSPHLRPAPLFEFPVAEIVEGPSEPQWNLTNIGADRVWAELGVTGEGIVVGQSDTGVQGDHSEFADRYRGVTAGNDYNWYDPWQHRSAPYDEGGHGTHTLGSILGKSVGVAPGATWFGCANLVRNVGNPALYLDCMQFMLAPFPQNGDPLRDGDPSRAADVLNNSWGCPTAVEGCAPDVYAGAVQALTDAGIFVVVSAGNEGPSCGSINTPPAIYEPVLSVGAMDDMGNLADFSSVGPVTVDGSGRTKPDILAPGVDVVSAWPGNRYSSLSGTSMAGPHLVGTVALMWSASPALRGDVARTKQILEETAHAFHGTLDSEEEPAADESATTDTTNSVGALVEQIETGGSSCLAQSDLNVIPNNVAGYGIVDAYAAVKAALALQ